MQHLKTQFLKVLPFCWLYCVDLFQQLFSLIQIPLVYDSFPSYIIFVGVHISDLGELGEKKQKKQQLFV